jgi:threonine/homoserine/homoserine lactone efflux protein
MIGGIFIIIFSILQINSILKNKKIEIQKYITITNSNIGNPILIGFIFTILNPFFLVWWFTIGSKMISDSLVNFGLIEGTLLVLFSHIWMDFFWLWFTSFMISKGMPIIKEKIYRIFVFGINVILAIYGIYLLSINIII